jgi:hypothetical protein
MRDIEGKVAREAMSECGKRASFKAIEVLTAQLQGQAAQVQRVSAQLAAASPSRGGLHLTMQCIRDDHRLRPAVFFTSEL